MPVNPVTAKQIQALTPEQKMSIRQELAQDPESASIVEEIDRQLSGGGGSPQDVPAHLQQSPATPIDMRLAQQPVQPQPVQPQVQPQARQPIAANSVSPSLNTDIEQPKSSGRMGKFLNIGKRILDIGAGGAEGMLLGLQGRPISEHSAFQKTTPNYSEQLAQIELEEILRKRQEQAGGMQPNPGQEPQPEEQSNIRMMNQDEAPPMFIEKPKGKNKYGIMEYETIENPAYKRWEKEQDEEYKQSREGKRGEQIASRNIETVASAARRLSETYRDAFREGGVGSLGNKMKSGASLFLGGEMGQKFPATAALSGQKTEVITKMMPMLTQQGDKEGSVRLVSTVFDKLMKTLPEDNTPPDPAKRMITETIRNMFGFAKAMKQMGITNEAVEGLSEEQLKQIGDSVESVAQRIKLTPEEEQEQREIIEYVIAPLNELSNNQNEPQESGGVLMEDANGNRALVDPQTGMVIKEL